MSDRNQLSKFELSQMLFGHGRDVMPRHIYDSNGQQYYGLVQSVQREDGTGSSFNVTIEGHGGSTTIHLRTID